MTTLTPPLQLLSPPLPPTSPSLTVLGDSYLHSRQVASEAYGTRRPKETPKDAVSFGVNNLFLFPVPLGRNAIAAVGGYRRMFRLQVQLAVGLDVGIHTYMHISR